MDKSPIDSNNTSSQQSPPTPRAAPTAAEQAATADAVVAEMVADPEWCGKLSTYCGEVTFNAEAVREFSRRYNEKLELSEGVVGDDSFQIPEETSEQLVHKTLWLEAAKFPQLLRPEPSSKLPTEANWLVDHVEPASPQAEHEPTGNAGEVATGYSEDLLTAVWLSRTVRHCIVETLEIDRGDGSPFVTIGCDPGHGALLPFYVCDAEHAVLPSDVRKILKDAGKDIGFAPKRPLDDTSPDKEFTSTQTLRGCTGVMMVDDAFASIPYVTSPEFKSDDKHR